MAPPFDRLFCKVSQMCLFYIEQLERVTYTLAAPDVKAMTSQNDWPAVVITS